MDGPDRETSASEPTERVGQAANPDLLVNPRVCPNALIRHKLRVMRARRCCPVATAPSTARPTLPPPILRWRSLRQSGLQARRSRPDRRRPRRRRPAHHTPLSDRARPQRLASRTSSAARTPSFGRSASELQNRPIYGLRRVPPRLARPELRGPAGKIRPSSLLQAARLRGQFLLREEGSTVA